MKPIKHLLITIAMLLCSATASAYDFEVDGIYYNITSITDLTVEVTNGDNEYSDKVIIPETVVYKSKVLKVTSISPYAFNGCNNLTSVVIGNNVTSIIDETFSQCSNLTSVVTGNSVTSIGESAFYKCSNLTNVVIGNSVTSIGDGAFSSCARLTSVTIGNSVTSIGEYAFNYCSSLTSIKIPNSVTSIGDNAFANCKSLKELCIEDGTETLSLGCNESYYDDYGLFYYCPLETLYLGRNLSYSSYYLPFKQNKTLTSVTIGNSVTNIGEDAFYGCSSLTSIEIPNSVTNIGEDAFYGCSSLTSIEIPNSVTNIGKNAFYGCSSLTSIEIPNSVTRIGDGAFSFCTGLKKIEFKCAKIGTWFNGLSIEEVEIDYRVTSIAGGAFKNCSSLTNIHLLGETPPSVESNTFAESQYATLTIYVPQGSLSTYQSSDVWKNFWDIREESTTETPEEEVKKCATPVITYNDNGLDITTETDGAEIHTDITCSDANSYNGDRIDLSATYSITTYATKSGYLNSETVTATLCWIAVSGDSENNSIIKVEAMPVLITCNNGTINICGGEDGIEVIVYTTSGVAVGNATITNGNATISTGLAKGEIAVISIAGKGIKVVMQ